jgi:hypothetical protein
MLMAFTFVTSAISSAAHAQSSAAADTIAPGTKITLQKLATVPIICAYFYRLPRALPATLRGVREGNSRRFMRCSLS